MSSAMRTPRQRVYKGRLRDGREVAIKHITVNEYSAELFGAELDILQQLRHKHIVRLLGSCVTMSMVKRLLPTLQKKKKGLLTRWRKEPEEPPEPDRLIVYEYMENRTLFDHLHPDHGSSMLSLVTVSWKMHMDVLLGVSRAIEHLHCRANPPVIHRDIKSANILFDASWVPRLSDFGLSVTWDDMASEEGLELPVSGTFGYLDPEYFHTSRLKPTSDVHNLGILMLEVLTGRRTFSQGEEGKRVGLADLALPMIEAGNFGELLDRRPVPEPTPGQLKALEHVVQTEACPYVFRVNAYEQSSIG